jgi:hypothetical protein
VFPGDIATVSLVSDPLYWLTDGAMVCAQIVGPGDVVVLRGGARSAWKHEVARPKLNIRLGPVGARIITEHESPRLELGVEPAEKDAWCRLAITFRSVFPERVVTDFGIAKRSDAPTALRAPGSRPGRERGHPRRFIDQAKLNTVEPWPQPPQGKVGGRADNRLPPSFIAARGF